MPTHVACRLLVAGFGFAGLLQLAGCGAFVPASKVDWPESHQDAVAESRESGKPILMLFTGSDWCVWCQRLESEVFATAAFEEWAAENVVLLKLDFPQYRSQSPKIKRQNDELMAEYEGYVEGFPTVLVTTSSGEVLGDLGYESGGPHGWIDSAEQIIDEYSK